MILFTCISRYALSFLFFKFLFNERTLFIDQILKSLGLLADANIKPFLILSRGFDAIFLKKIICLIIC